MKRVTTLALAILVFTLIFAGTVLAGSGEYNGITLFYPDNMTSCEPTFTFSTSGVAADWTVQYNIFSVTDTGNLVQIGSGTTTGDLNVTFTPDALEPNTTQGYAVFVAVFNADGTLKAKLRGKWDVTCEGQEPTPTPTPPPTGGEGCTPGYWRQEHHFDSWALTPYAPSDAYDPTFGVDGSFDTLLAAVWARGGGENALARHAVAALLNASSPDVNYAYTVDEILAGVQNAYATGDFEPFKDALDAANNAGCPLN